MVVQYCKTYTGRADGETGFTDRTNGTVREDIYGSWIKFFNPWKSQFVTKGSFEKFVDPYGSYGPYELKMASRIVRTVRFVKMVYGSWIKFSNPWKNQFVTIREALKNSSIRTDRTDRTNWKWLHGSYEPYGSWKGFTDREYSFSIGERIRLWLSEA